MSGTPFFEDRTRRAGSSSSSLLKPEQLLLLLLLLLLGTGSVKAPLEQPAASCAHTLSKPACDGLAMDTMQPSFPNLAPNFFSELDRILTRA